MKEIDTSTLIDPQNGNLAFKIFSFSDGNHFDHIQRLNYHSIIVIQNGMAKLKADFSEYFLEQNCLLYFSPFQPFMLSDVQDLEGICLNFHSDFFCIYKHHQEIACNGILFNNIYQKPFIILNDEELKGFVDLIDLMRKEVQSDSLAQHELLISYLKILLISATRIKLSQYPDNETEVQPGSEHYVIQNFKDAIEKHFKTMHSPSEYANLLNIPVNTLAKISKSHFNKTLTDLITERIVIEAKRELYLTSKAVKQIASELGFNDEYYFSRFFKNNTEVSPKQFRESAGFARAEN
ncbi:MAG: AraC family transcriptional regulator [Bacteroidetes bacterium]|nr:MAG: AraC family transcriptional regulator [Bacteroidota bacterium]